MEGIGSLFSCLSQMAYRSLSLAHISDNMIKQLRNYRYIVQIINLLNKHCAKSSE